MTQLTSFNTNQWKTIDMAPKGTTKKLKVKDKMVDVFEPQWIWAAGSGLVSRSQWLPKENRWEAFTAENPPTHWHPYMPKFNKGDEK